MSDTVYFSVKSGLKDIIGRDLILDDNIAIFELVKNSYDAHAKNVIITFEKNKIVIADDGKGMSYSDLTSKWLSVAWSAKNDGTEDNDIEYEKQRSYRDLIHTKRYYAGAKGIGRFSADRLGSDLILTTSKFGDDKIEQLHVIWDKFNKKDKSNKLIKQDFEKIPVEHETLNYYPIPFPQDSPHGTILEITGTTNWDRATIKTLKHSLEKLINPFSETDEFSITIVCEEEKNNDNSEVSEREKVNGVIKNSILDVIKLKTTHLEITVLNNNIESKLYDRETLIYHIKEHNKNNPFVDNLKIDLYYLNRSAKNNFSRIMGVQPFNYGSVFLFKNGFRVQPYGEFGDDSWGLNTRAQQGYNRFLSTRELFGRIDIISDDSEQFKEVSSRDGGLKKTTGYYQIQEIFWDKALKRLERYVVGVLWGEAFVKNNYFKSKSEAQKLREALQEKDKDSEDFSVAKTNIGSKIDFVRLIKSMTDNKDINIISFNKEFIDFVNENIENVEEKFIDDLKKIAESTDDEEMWNKVNDAENAINRIKEEKEQAEKRAKEEETRRRAAEQRAREEEEKRKLAEQKAKEEEEKRRLAEHKAKEEELKRKDAELEKEKKEKARLKAELDKIKAEQEAKAEKDKREKIEQEKEKVDTELEQEKKQGIFQRSLIGREKEQILGLQHQINHSSSRIKNNIKSLLKHMNKSELDAKMQKYIAVISLESAKIESISTFVTNANFDLKASEIEQDIIQFIDEYIKEIYLPETPILNTGIDIKIVKNNNLKYIIEFRPLEITTLVDNFIQNAEKAEASEIVFDIQSTLNNRILINISNNGKTIPNEQVDRIFDLGFTTTNGSGIGLFHVKTVIDRMKGKINVIPGDRKGVIFKIEI